MAGKYGSPSAFFFVAGYNWLGAKLQSLMLKIESLTNQTDGLGDNHEAHTPVGKKRLTLSQAGGFWDTGTSNVHAAMAAGVPTTPQATPRISCVGCMGATVGAVFYGVQAGFTTAYELILGNSQLTKANVTHLLAGDIEVGQVVQPLATQTGDWNTESGSADFALDPSQRTVPITSNSEAAASVVETPVAHGLATGHVVLISDVVGSSPDINGEQTVTVIDDTHFSVPVDTSAGDAGAGGSFVRCNSLNGAAGYQQVLALTGFTGYVGKLRDSADDTTFADLVTFADVTAAPDAQRVAVAGTVDRYVAHDGNVTGSGSLQAFSGIARL